MLRISPKPTLLILCFAAIPLGLWLALALPNPFEGERPSRILMFFRVAGALMAVLAAWRLGGWSTLTADGDGVELRGLIGGRRRHLWRDLLYARLDAASGQPPAYRLRFQTGKVNLVARHHRPADIAALRELMVQATRPPSAAPAG